MRRRYDFSNGMRNKYAKHFKKEKKRYQRIAAKTIDRMFDSISMKDFKQNIEGIVDQYCAIIMGYA